MGFLNSKPSVVSGFGARLRRGSCAPPKTRYPTASDLAKPLNSLWFLVSTQALRVLTTRPELSQLPGAVKGPTARLAGSWRNTRLEAVDGARGSRPAVSSRARRVLKKHERPARVCSGLLRPETHHPVECISVQVSLEAFDVFASTFRTSGAGVTRRTTEALLHSHGRSLA